MYEQILETPITVHVCEIYHAKHTYDFVFMFRVNFYILNLEVLQHMRYLQGGYENAYMIQENVFEIIDR